MNVLLMILGLALFFALVVVHEFGHFIMAKRNGVEVLEFGIGFPPRLFRKRTSGGWDFTINLLPLGGFVRLKGEHDTDTEPGSFGAASVWGKTQIMAAGVVMNLVAAYVLFVIVALIGMPQLVDNQFMIKSDAVYVSHAQRYVTAGLVEANSPAARAGIAVGDRLQTIGLPGQLQPITDGAMLSQFTKLHAGQVVVMSYSHGANSTVITKQLELRSNEEVSGAKASGKQEGYLGVAPDQVRSGVTSVRSTWSAPIVAAGVIGQFTQLTFQGLGKALQGLGGIIAGIVTQNTAARQAAQSEASSQVAGPVGIYFVFKEGSRLGIRFVLFIVAALSLTLAIMNILPIPALDGGRLWLMLFTRAIKKPLQPHHEELINATGFAVLIGLMILITIVDVRRFL